MRLRVYAVLACAIFLGGASAFAAALPASTAGQVAAYRFNEASGTVAADATGAGHAGTLRAARFTKLGKYAGAISLVGPSPYRLALRHGIRRIDNARIFSQARSTPLIRHDGVLPVRASRGTASAPAGPSDFVDAILTATNAGGSASGVSKAVGRVSSTPAKVVVSRSCTSPSSVTIGGTAKAQGTLENTGGTAITLPEVILAGRPPGGTNGGGPFDDFSPTSTNVVLNPGATFTIKASSHSPLPVRELVLLRDLRDVRRYLA